MFCCRAAEHPPPLCLPLPPSPRVQEQEAKQRGDVYLALEKYVNVNYLGARPGGGGGYRWRLSLAADGGGGALGRRSPALKLRIPKSSAPPNLIKTPPQNHQPPSPPTPTHPPTPTPTPPNKGFHKILKKHDKNVPHAPCRQFYLAHLHQQPWVQARAVASLCRFSRCVAVWHPPPFLAAPPAPFDCCLAAAPCSAPQLEHRLIPSSPSSSLLNPPGNPSNPLKKPLKTSSKPPQTLNDQTRARRAPTPTCWSACRTSTVRSGATPAARRTRTRRRRGRGGGALGAGWEGRGGKTSRKAARGAHPPQSLQPSFKPSKPSKPPPPSPQGFVRSTTKYWVCTEDVSAVKNHVLQHLPVFQYDKDDFSGDAQLVNSVYLAR